jgi:hypothetical protein
MILNRRAFSYGLRASADASLTTLRGTNVTPLKARNIVLVHGEPEAIALTNA